MTATKTSIHDVSTVVRHGRLLAEAASDSACARIWPAYHDHARESQSKVPSRFSLLAVAYADALLRAKGRRGNPFSDFSGVRPRDYQERYYEIAELAQSDSN